MFVAVATGGTVAASSPDGITWTTRTIPTAGYCGVAYGGGMFVAVANDGGTVAASSPDGITWTTRTIPAANYRSVAYGAVSVPGNVGAAPAVMTALTGAPSPTGGATGNGIAAGDGGSGGGYTSPTTQVGVTSQPATPGQVPGAGGGGGGAGSPAGAAGGPGLVTVSYWP